MDTQRPHWAAPPPPPSTVDQRAPPQQHLPPYPHHQPQPQTPSGPQAAPFYPPPYASQPPPTGGGPGVALPPIQQHLSGPPGPAQDQQSLPPIGVQPQHHPYDPRDRQPQEFYNNHNHSNHATPAPVNRTFSHDSTHQREPTTPAQAGPYPAAVSGPDGPPPPHMMDRGPHHGYTPTNGVSHGLPPGPPPPPHHDSHPPYMQPMMEQQHAPYGQVQQPMYPQPGYPGPVSASQFQIQRKKQMRATQVCPSQYLLRIVSLTRDRPANNVDKGSRNVTKVILVHSAKRTI